MAPKSKDKKVDRKSKKKQKETENVEPNNENLNAADRLRNDGIVTTFALNSKKVHKNVRDISVSNLTVTFHGSPLVEEAELTLNYGNRYGYIGRNGCGKSTFMKVIAARSFPIPDGIDIFHLREEIDATDLTAKEAVMLVDEERAKLEAEADSLNEQMISLEEGSEEAEDVMDRINQIYERLDELDASTAEARASKILAGLGFTPEKQSKKTREFSGGWRMRIALARALFIQPTLLLLDEPTNHLDMEAVVWLEDYLKNWNKILFMVSHSQDFLNNVCTHIVHHTKRKLIYYTGNYDQFVKTRTEKEEEQEKRYKAEQDQIKHMKSYVAKFGQGNAKMAKQAQSKEKTLEKMLRSGLTEKVEHEKALDFKFPDPAPLTPPVLQCNDLTFGYPNSDLLYKGVDFGVDLDSRVALVGPNGAGKSTLLKLLTGDLIPITGAVRPHPHLRISKFSQHFVDVLDLEMTPLDYFMSLWEDLTREECRKFLGRFGISGGVQTQKMEQLSDGQKSRVVIAKMARENPHVLFLDEPTNHLDMESIDSLAKAINNFQGGMVLVSHDMRLISQVAKEIWLCDNKTVSKFVGEISDFKMQLRQQMSLDGNSKKVEMKLAPLVPKKLSMSSNNLKSDKLEDELIQQARKDLADLNLAREKAKESQKEREKKEIEEQELEDLDKEEKERLKAEEKALAKAKRKAEKEAMFALKQKEEEERERRKEEKLRDAEEAKRLKEIQEQQYQEFLQRKAAKEAKKKAEEDEILQKLIEEKARRKAEKEERKRKKAEAAAKAKEEARIAMEKAVISDPWTQEQQDRFEEAILEYPAFMDRFERWSKIAEMVGEKSKNQCLMRYKYLKDLIIERKNASNEQNAE